MSYQIVILSLDQLPIFILTFNAIQFLKGFFFFSFLGPYPQHMEVPRLGVQSEL